MRANFSHHFHFHFFDTRELGALSIMLGMIYFGSGLINIFVPIYFWTIGFPIWKILLFYLLYSVYFLGIIFLSLPFLKRISDTFMIALSIPFLVLYFLLLNSLSTHSWFFWIAPALLALHAIFLNVGYNLDFACATEKGREGHEVGVRFLTSSLSQFLAPFFGGFLISYFGFHATFYVATIIFLFSTIPLFFVRKQKIDKNLSATALVNSLTRRQDAMFNISAVGYATEFVVGNVLWPVFMFFALASTELVGGVTSVAFLLGAIITYVVGISFDKGRALWFLGICTSLLSLNWFSRSFFASGKFISLSHITGNIFHSGTMVSWVSEYYTLAHASDNPAMFVLSKEVLYQIIRLFFIVLLIALSLVLPISIFFPVSFAVAGLLSILFISATKKAHI